MSDLMIVVNSGYIVDMATRQFTSLYFIRRQCRQSIVNYIRPVSTGNTPVVDKQSTKSFADIPGPGGIYSLPYIGIGLQFYPFSDLKLNNINKKAKLWNEQYGAICKVRTTTEWILFVFDPDDVETVLRNDKKHPTIFDLQLYKTYNKRRNRIPALTDRNGDDWWELRRPAQKNIAPPRAAAKYIPKLSAVSDDFIEYCRAKGSLADLPDPLIMLAMESVGMMCFNRRLGCIETMNSDGNKKLIAAYQAYFKYFGEQAIAPVQWFRWFRTPGYVKFEEAADVIFDMIDKYVDIHYKELQENQESSNDVSVTRDLLKYPGMTPEKATAILIDFLRGGVETTANSIMFLLYQLAKHPDKQEILYNEVLNRLGLSGVMDENSLNNMPYIKACLKESMRLVSPFGGVPRILDKEIELSGYTVPAGVVISLQTGNISRNETYFRDADKFEPERWLREEKEYHPFATIPFGFGPRSCLGQRIAQQEIYINVAKILLNFCLSLPEDSEEPSITYHISVTTEKPVTINLKPRC